MTDWDEIARRLPAGPAPGAPTRDPSTETWRETVGLSTSAQLRQTQREAAELTELLLQARQEIIRTHRSLAASQQDLTSVEAERDGVREELTRQANTNEDLRATLAMRDRQLREAETLPCAWLDLAVAAMQERDLACAQLDDAIATFRADKETRP